MTASVVISSMVVSMLLLLAPMARADDTTFFESRIRPLLTEKCYACHSVQSGKSKGGLQLDTRAHVLAGGENGAVLVAGDPAKSKLIEAVRHTNPELKMPPKERLSDAQINDLVEWVKQGAPDPRVDSAQTASAGPYDFAAARKQWAFSLPREPALPAVKNAGWAKNDIDRFILAKLEDKGLAPAPPADKRTLIRRATFDLTGLPATPEEIDAFIADSSPDAFAKVIDRLLASSAYGERWARHWLDVVRYTDSFDARGVGNDGDCKTAWRYRDWVVGAFNNDLPYDQFVRRQIAGDLIPSNDPDDFGNLIATQVYVFGNWPGGDADRKKMITDMVDDQIDLTGRAFLGVTLGCARCHDHKFDPIPQADYYSLAGIFFSSHFMPGQGTPGGGGPLESIPMISTAEAAKIKERNAGIAQWQKEVDAETTRQVAQVVHENLASADRYLAAAWELSHAPPGTPADKFAADRKLSAPMVLRWSDYVRPYFNAASPAGPTTLLSKVVVNASGVEGLLNLRRPDDADCPNVALNTKPHELTVTTLTLPPLSVSMHPGPMSAVAVVWKSPITATVSISGRVVDGDAHCGDGIAWRVSHIDEKAGHDLASGGFNDGGSQDLAAGDGHEQLQAVKIKAGESIQLTIYPKGNYACDTTVTELQITQSDGEHRTWSLTHDMLGSAVDLQHLNPHADALGHDGVWTFIEAPNAVVGAVVNRANALGQWAAEVSSNPQMDGEHLLASAHAVREALTSLESGMASAKQQAENTAALLAGVNGSLYRDLTDQGGPFFARKVEETEFAPDKRDTLRSMRDKIKQLQDQNKAVPTTNGMEEGGIPDSIYAGISDAKIHQRGRYDHQTQTVPRQFPRLFAGDVQTPITRGSGRLQLAEWVGSASNPMTAKVMANRIWQHHFGEGIVRTANNFGKLGVPATHPELLDYLATQFVKSGWSIKSMHRLIMLSSAYQQSSEPLPETYKADPDNLLFGHMNRQRMEAEGIRDTLLAVSGGLDRTMGGVATRDLNSPRRTLYVMTIRSDRSDYRALFDAADPTAIAEKRIESTVAPQALFLMNNPFVLTRAKALVERMQKQTAEADPVRIAWLYRLLYGRQPTADETQIGIALLNKSRAGAKPEQAWEEYAQVLLCTDELVFVD